MKKNLLFLLLLFFTITTYAQNICGYEFTESEANRFRETRALASQLPLTRSVKYVPIQFHVIGKNDGTGYVKIGLLLDELCCLNEQYAEHDIQFYIHDEINFINNTTIYEGGGLSIMFANKVPSVLNFFIPNAATTGGPGTTLGYFSPGADLIVIIKGEIGASTSCATSGHEIGHFFNLPHTFGDCLEAVDDPCPAPAFCGGQETELVDGSNCETAGDGFCDTPADIGLGFYSIGECEDYAGGACDPNGDPYDPDEENYMGYFIGCADYHFSNEQAAHMNLSLMARESSSLALTNNNSTTTHVSEGAVINTFSTTNMGLSLGWDAVDGADRYFVEVSRTPNFTFQYSFYITDQTSLEVMGLNQDKAYYVRIRPFNELSGCGFMSGDPLVLVTKVDKTIDQLNTWQVIPNPSHQNESKMLLIESVESLELDIKVMNIAGQLVWSDTQQVRQGNNQIELLDRLPSGVYLVSLQSAKGIEVRKMIVQ